MTRRIKRFDNFDAAINIKNDQFIQTPQGYQRNWLIGRALNEFVSDINALDPIARRFVAGSHVQAMDDRTQANLADEEIMEDWQIPIMKAMAEVVTSQRGHILEIGFGRGIGSSFIQQCGADKHTIIECNHSIVGRFNDWKSGYSTQVDAQNEAQNNNSKQTNNIVMEVGLWQDVLPTLGQFDGIFFHTYPLNESDHVEQIGETITFAEHFFEHAAQHLKQGGIFTYLSNEIDSLSRHHQRQLFKHFSSIEMRIVDQLAIPNEVKDQWWSDSMVVVKAVK